LGATLTAVRAKRSAKGVGKGFTMQGDDSINITQTCRPNDNTVG
jgi:hypothetical protein